MKDSTPAGKVRHKFGKNCAIDKYFGIHVKNRAVVTSKSRIRDSIISRFENRYYNIWPASLYLDLQYHFGHLGDLISHSEYLQQSPNQFQNLQSLAEAGSNLNQYTRRLDSKQSPEKNNETTWLDKVCIDGILVEIVFWIWKRNNSSPNPTGHDVSLVRPRSMTSSSEKVFRSIQK